MPNIERYILLTPEEKKLCPKCGEANEFYKGTYYPRGVSFLCKVCLSKRRKESVARHPETFKQWRIKNPPNKEKLKEYNHQWYLKNKEKSLKRSKKWKNDNQERLSATNKDYKENNEEKCRNYNKQWRLNNRKRITKIAREWVKNNQEKVNKINKKWIANNPQKIKEIKSRRRSFGFIPLNTYRDGDEAHHINKELVIYIPKSIHKSIHHSVLKNKNMDKINSVAFSYLHWT